MGRRGYMPGEEEGLTCQVSRRSYMPGEQGVTCQVGRRSYMPGGQQGVGLASGLRATTD